MHNPHGAPLSVFTRVPGWETVPEQYTLHAQASIVPEGGVIVEIGAQFGMSASIFCMAADKSVEIYSIDLFPYDLMRLHRDNLVEAGYGKKLDAGYYAMRNIPLQGDSYELGQHWRVTAQHHGRNGHNIDLLFIDGDHSYNGVVRDIAAWTPHVKVGGVVIFHDAAPETNRNPHPLHYEVQRAIDEWASPAWLEQPSCDSMRIFIRQR